MSNEAQLTVISPSDGTPILAGSKFEVVGNAFFPVTLTRGERSFTVPRGPEVLILELVNALGRIISRSALDLGEIFYNFGLYRKSLTMPVPEGEATDETLQIRLYAVFRPDGQEEIVKSEELTIRSWTTTSGETGWSPETNPGASPQFTISQPTSRSRVVAGFTYRIDAVSDTYSDRYFVMLNILDEEQAVLTYSDLIQQWRRSTGRRVRTTLIAPTEAGRYRLLLQVYPRTAGTGIVASSEGAFRVRPAQIGSEDLVDLNLADLTELVTLPGIGEAIAEAIVEQRPLLDLEDLRGISGVTSSVLEKIRPRTTLTLEI